MSKMQFANAKLSPTVRQKAQELLMNLKGHRHDSEGNWLALPMQIDTETREVVAHPVRFLPVGVQETAIYKPVHLGFLPERVLPFADQEVSDETSAEDLGHGFESEVMAWREARRLRSTLS